MYESYEDLPKVRIPNDDINVSDSTIRDGAQMPGIVMKDEHKLKVFEYLHKIGIEKLETFLYTEKDREVAKEMVDRNYERPEVTGWARANPKDIDLVINMDGIKETGILMSSSDIHMSYKLNLTREETTNKYLGALEYAVDHGLRVRCHLEDATRSDMDFLALLVKEIIDREPNAIIRVCDTLGYGIPVPNVPFSIPDIITQLKNLGVKNIETHIHDDYGMGMVNSLIGFWYGANWSNLTFMAIGERAGNAELEKILVFLEDRVDGFHKYDLSCLTEFAAFMEENVGIRVPRNKAVVGKNIFAHESGIHAAGVIKEPFVYEPYPPELVGGERMLLIGDTSGMEVIRYKVEETLRNLLKLDVKVDKKDPRIKHIQKDIQELYARGERISCISDEELVKLIEKHFLLESMVGTKAEE